MSISSLDSMYVPKVYSLPKRVPFKQTNVQSQPYVQPQQYNTVPHNVSVPVSQEPSLASQLTSSALIMGPIMGRHVIMHPIQSTLAAKSAGKIYQSLLKKGSLDAMTSSQKVEVFNTLYNAARNKAAVLKEGLRPAADTAKLASEFAKSQKGFIDAVKAGDTVAAAQNAAQINTIASKGTKGLFGGVKDAETVIDASTKAGVEASAAAAKTASTTVAATSKLGKAVAWSKDAFYKQGGPIFLVIEGLIEAPEVIAAFSEGGTGEGLKQTAKSAVKITGSVGGWCLGAKGGAAAGAAIGTAICPGIGTAIGSAIGLIAGGITGSWAGNKVAKAITGKSYNEKKEEMAQAQLQPLPIPQKPFAVPGMYPSIYDLK